MAYEADRAPPDDDLLAYARQLCNERLSAYLVARHDAEEHANIELSVLAGGYAYRQIAELVQNAADAVADGGSDGRIVIIADGAGLWAANTGSPVDRDGVRALLNAHASGKRAGQIGRFGIGFKSLLKLGGSIAVLSRTVSLIFNPEACRQEIRSVLGLPADAPAPGLRLATPCSWEDGVRFTRGAERFDWATTVVFAELVTAGAREAVLEEMRRFAPEFLLFLPVDVELVLKGDDLERRLRRSTAPDGAIVIEDLAAEGRPAQTWRVFQTDVRVQDQAALADATSVHARETVPLIWAAPVNAAREAAGRFFAFFPTSTETRTLGILNAPWKLNSDRTALIPGAWNAALMEAAAELIASNACRLVQPDDPGAVLDAFPRELQLQSEPAAPLVSALWERLLDAPVLANCDGELTAAANLRRAPLENADLIRSWSRLADGAACAAHLHPTCTSTPARISRLNQLSERLNARAGPQGEALLSRTSAADWLAMAASGEPPEAIDTLKLADAWARVAPGQAWDAIRDEVALILAEDGTLQAAPVLTLATPAVPPFRSVHPDLSASPQARAILRDRFSIHEEESADWERLLDARIAAAERSDDWEPVWGLLRRVPREDLEDLLSWRSVSVRTLAGWADASSVFRFGDLIGAGDLATLSGKTLAHLQGRIVDERVHGRDNAILAALSIGDAPDWNWSPHYSDGDRGTLGGEFLASWKARYLDAYWEELERRPEKHLLTAGAFQLPNGWDLLLAVGEQKAAAVSAAILGAISAGKSHLAPVNFRHSTRPGAWAAGAFPHPLWLLMFSRGVLETATGKLDFKSLLVSQIGLRAALVPSLTSFAPVLEHLQKSGANWVSGREDAEIWASWLAYVAQENVELGLLQPLYEAAARAGVAPLQVCTAQGPVDIAQVLVAPSLRDAEAAHAAGVTAVWLDQELEAVWLAAGARPLAEVAQLIFERSGDGDAVPLAEVEPALAGVIRTGQGISTGVIFTTVLRRRIDGVENDLAWSMHDGTLLILESAFLTLTWPDRVALLMEGASAGGWLREDADLEAVMSTGTEARRRAVAAEADAAARLLKAVGGVETLCRLFEPDVATQLRADPERAARVTLTLFGPALLTEPEIREAMTREGLKPPSRWGAGAAAEFVAALGLPAEFAVSPDRKREPEMLVGGPVPLKPLHDYQETVVEQLKPLLEVSDDKRRRAVISLPTGAGKTRVAAQTAVDQVLLPDDHPNRLVVWIAQTDELCEQAVQCFRELWINLGRQGESLRMIRLWGSQANPQPPERGEPTVVVASIQTLTARLNAAPLEWVSRPGLVVIDECHHALTPSYTALMRWLSQDGAAPEPPIVGLSATPFRGRNENETAQLARRFDGRLIPKDQSGLFDDLQRRGVLASFDYTRLEMERRFHLTPEEERHMTTFGKLPDSALERLGEDDDRNDRILDAMTQARERSALVFATSVKHARRLAARLNLAGIASAVVSGETDRNSRRWFVRAFQSGDVRVLCNHSALTTGFDAPATDLIVIARPVFSPALYMQMVGRGLRGPLNGGKNRCRILTVQDNLDLYSGQLAHHYFEKYYVQG